jgi:hypothetical protein
VGTGLETIVRSSFARFMQVVQNSIGKKRLLVQYAAVLLVRHAQVSRIRR